MSDSGIHSSDLRSRSQPKHSTMLGFMEEFGKKAVNGGKKKQKSYEIPFGDSANMEEKVL